MATAKRQIEFGIAVLPSADGIDELRAYVRRADELGIDLVGLQDHPYNETFLETFTLMADLLARTERIRIFPDVANLPVRSAAMLAKHATTLDVLSGGRFELGIGAGYFWEGIGAFGGSVREPREQLEALDEAIGIIRRFWSGESPLTVEGRHYAVKGLQPGPMPAHPLRIWVGAYKPGMLRLIGRAADGWIPSLPFAPPDVLPEGQRLIDEAAHEAGRDPSEIRRMYNVMGSITDGGVEDVLRGPPEYWVEQLSTWARDCRLDTFIVGFGGNSFEQLERLATEVIPGVREVLGSA